MATVRPAWAAIYARVSPFDQTTENQVTELRRFVSVRLPHK